MLPCAGATLTSEWGFLQALHVHVHAHWQWACKICRMVSLQSACVLCKQRQLGRTPKPTASTVVVARASRSSCTAAQSIPSGQGMGQGILDVQSAHQPPCLFLCWRICAMPWCAPAVGGLHPRGSLYERPVNIDSAKTQHATFREVRHRHPTVLQHISTSSTRGLCLSAAVAVC